MTALPEEALQKLICSSCKKYLSVFPIKVYPNKKVKCGRCCESEEDDGGTVSRLYEQIAKQVEFPCINRFEGCKEVLGPNEMKKHEDTCFSDDYQCPLCNDFNGPSFDLLNHMKINHKKAAIENKEFWIELQDGLKSDTYFYCQNSFFVFVKYQYDSATQEIMLFLDVIGKHQTGRKNVEYTFLLYSIHNKLQYKSGIIKSLESDLNFKEGLKIDIASHRYPKKIMICKFQLWDSTVMLKKYQFDKKQAYVQCELLPQILNTSVQCELPPIFDQSKNKAVLVFKFHGVNKYKIDGSHNSKHKYWLGDQLWWLNIGKKENVATNYMNLYLCKDKSNGPCKIVATVTLKSLPGENCNFSVNTENIFVNEDNWGWSQFIKWNDLTSKTNGYVNNDSIEIHVLLEVLPQKDPKCANCEKLCTSCT